jgi:GGDEF domain-containing protein/integral membrane sensor domain MASE1
MRTEIPCQYSIAACLRSSLLLQMVAVAWAYAVSAHFAATYSSGRNGTVVLWLPNAVVLSAMLLNRSNTWWKFVLTQMATELVLAASGDGIRASLGIALSNLLEVLLAAGLVRRCCGRRFAFANVRQVVLFVGIAMGLAPGLAALLGTWLHYQASAETVSFTKHWQMAWMADGMGLVVLTPVLFGWLYLPRPSLRRALPAGPERLLFVAVLAGLVHLMFYAAPDPHSPWVGSPLLLLPLFLWAALRLGICGVSLLGGVVSLLAIVLTSQGRGMFSLLDAGMQTLLLQQYLAALLLSSLAVAAIVNDLAVKYHRLLHVEHKLATAHGALTVLNQQLEERVAQRTAELEHLATTDSLTDAYNRRYLMERAEVDVSLARRQSYAVSMVMFDIDHFKRINDNHGHSVGDRVLVALSQAVQQGLRLGDTFARVGGEEFVLLLPTRTRSNPCRWPSGCAAWCRNWQWDSKAAWYCASWPASAWPLWMRSCAAWTRCMSQPTWPCTGPKRRGATAW